MGEPFSNLTGPETVGLAAIIIGSFAVAVVSVVGIVVPHWRGAKRSAAETQLKRDLIAAGFTADEIERVVTATAAGGPRRGDRPASRVGSPS